jgi:hypothetical protein
MTVQQFPARQARDNPLVEKAQMVAMSLTQQRDANPPRGKQSSLQQRHDLDSNAAEIAAHARRNTSI